VVFAEQYDFVITLLLLSDEIRFDQLEAEDEPDTYDRFVSRA
jgi:hypothetical protein